MLRPYGVPDYESGFPNRTIREHGIDCAREYLIYL